MFEPGEGRREKGQKRQRDKDTANNSDLKESLLVSTWTLCADSAVLQMFNQCLMINECLYSS